jgi:hypothetical protein
MRTWRQGWSQTAGMLSPCFDHVALLHAESARRIQWAPHPPFHGMVRVNREFTGLFPTRLKPVGSVPCPMI